MFTFISFDGLKPTTNEQYDKVHHLPDDGHEFGLDLDSDGDVEDFGADSLHTKLTSPGEALTSSQAFMRYGLYSWATNMKHAHLSKHIAVMEHT